MAIHAFRIVASGQRGFSTEKSLADCVYNLQAEFENAARFWAIL
jgi:hypothetical protein